MNIILSNLDDYLDYSLFYRLFWICSFTFFFFCVSFLLDLQCIKYVADARTLSPSTGQVFACQVYVCEQTSWPWFENLGHIAPRIGVVIRLYTMTCCIRLSFGFFYPLKANLLYTITIKPAVYHAYVYNIFAYILNLEKEFSLEKELTGISSNF